MEKLHLFYCNDSHRGLKIHSVRLLAYLEEARDGEVQFKEIEKIRLHSIIGNKTDHVRFEHYYDTDSCHYSGSNSLKDLVAWKKKFYNVEPIDLRNYERIRKVIFSIYARHNKGLDFGSVK